MTAAGAAPAGGGGLSTVFMGTPEIAVPALQRLSRLTRVRLVVTQPDRPAGRGHQLHEPAVKRAARDLGLPLWQPETLRGQAGAAELQGADLFVVMAYGELQRQEVLELPRAGSINLHASLLPRWRGASPLQAALRAGDRATGVTVMRMVRALDAGPIYLARPLALAERTTLPALHDSRSAPSPPTPSPACSSGWPGPAPAAQDEAQATVCRKLTAEDGRLRFDCSPHELERWVRAYTPAPGCWALAGSERLRVLALEPRPGLPGLAPGALAVHDGELLVGCAGGAGAILRLQAAGKRVMEAADYLRGHRLPERLA